ncbi:MAG: 2,3-bisphosphoglycerate-independent phosphoglycerate mutase [Patescibacteria group bacterium]
MKKYKPVVLVILDGLGVSQDKIGSPWETAVHPTFSEIEKNYPFTVLQASGLAVGLPWGKEGNSEVGHLTMGAGRIIYNYLPKISVSIEDRTFFNNEAFQKAIEHVNKNNSSLHIIGLFSSGTVHAYYKHLYALLDLMKQKDLKNVFLHLFTDGKDAYNKEGASFFKKLEEDLKKEYVPIKIASTIGRKYAMDRDENWDRIEKTYNLFVRGVGSQFQTVSSYIKEQYEKEIYDESIEPALVSNSPESRIKDSDAVIFFNFREDSARELTHAFIDVDFNNFNREKINNLLFITMTEYDKNIPIIPAFKSANIENPLVKIISDIGLNQLHIAETEKYAHITYFFNGGKEEPFEREERILIPSPEVESYEQTPEMSALETKNALLENILKYDFIAVNFANADMVGHTGNLEATARALETLDSCLKEIMEKVLEIDGALIVTSDHGNAEEKIYKMTGEKKSMHSLNPVPFYLISKEIKKLKPANQEKIDESYKDIKGTLTDIAPTILELLGLRKPPEMTGDSLIDKIVYS